MPLLDLREVSPHQVLATWKITEGEEQLKQELNLSIEEDFSDVSHGAKRKEWLTSRILLSKITEYMGVVYSGVIKDSFGKPWLKNSSFFISVTHCYPFVCVILDKDREVGIDLERSREQIHRIAPKFMSSAEWEYDSHPDYQLILWAAKEALYKLHGRKSLEFKSQLLIDPFTVEQHGTLTGNIIDGNIERHNLAYRFINDSDYVLVYSVD